LWNAGGGMASPRKRILSLNLGSQSIELAEFRADPNGGLTLQGYHTREILADPAEGIRQAPVAELLREILHELKIKNGNVNYAIAENLVFTRFVKLPSIDNEKIDRIVAFEAQQNVPFPIDEVVWDYQRVGGCTEEEIQVVLVAIKADLLEEINVAVEATGLRTSIVDVAPMALYNAFRYNYRDISGCSLLIDIGARTTNLLFIEPEKLFCRSVPIGGSSITSAIAKEFNEPFAAAEARKKRDGFARLISADAEPESVRRVSKIVGGTVARLQAEVMRSISHYRGQQQGNAPQRIFLAGGCAGTPCLREVLHEEFKLPVELFNPLRNVAIADSASVSEIVNSAHLLGEPVGLALRAAGDCPMKLNLRPASVLRRHVLEKRRPSLIAAAACFILGLLAWGVYYTRAAQTTRRMTEQTQAKIDIMRAAEVQIDKLRKESATHDSVATPLIAAINDRSFWMELLEELNVRLPKEDIWIAELIPTSGGKPVGVDERRATELNSSPAITAPPATRSTSTTKREPSELSIDGILIRGLYLFNPKQQEVAVDYFRNLAASAFFNVDAKNQARYLKPTTPNNTEWAFPYEVRLDLKKPMKWP
jgi:type IV pilus assembly protein PilM